MQKKKSDYFRKEEIVHNGKLYRIHNNYLTFGGGYLNSSIRSSAQKLLNIDYQFHIRREHFQVGFLMSGQEFRSNNNVQAHVGYGYRKETKTYNLAGFVGVNYFNGVREILDSVFGLRPLFYDGYGVYACVQGVKKIAYDFGIGMEVFAEYGKKQRTAGIKIIAFFSGAYRGTKKNFNPNVRSENPR